MVDLSAIFNSFLVLVGNPILLALFSGFFGALFLEIFKYLNNLIKRPQLKILNLGTIPIQNTITPGIYGYIVVENKGKISALDCRPKLILTDISTNKKTISHVAWGVPTNPDVYTLFPRQKEKIDLFIIINAKPEEFSIPIGVGERTTQIPGGYPFIDNMKKGLYDIEIEIHSENTYLKPQSLGKMTLPDKIIEISQTQQNEIDTKGSSY